MNALVIFNFYGSAFTGTFPSSISKSLDTLILRGSSLTGSLPYLGPAMTYIDLVGNSFTGNWPESSNYQFSATCAVGPTNHFCCGHDANPLCSPASGACQNCNSAGMLHLSLAIVVAAAIAIFLL